MRRARAVIDCTRRCPWMAARHALRKLRRNKQRAHLHFLLCQVFRLCDALVAAATKDDLRLFHRSRHPIGQQTGFLALHAGDINDDSTIDADEMVMPVEGHFVEGRAWSRVSQHNQSAIDQHRNDIIDGGARQRSSTRFQSPDQLINGTMAAEFQ
jgi:hypothetical protein